MEISNETRLIIIIQKTKQENHCCKRTTKETLTKGINKQ